MSLESSGVDVRTFDRLVECEDAWIDEDARIPCEWEGITDVDVDPETRTAIWECPACHTLHNLWTD